jgi:hypothetical protein
MATAETVLTIARSTLGEHEDPPGSNQIRFANWAGIPGLAWCGAWVCWVLDQAGVLDVPRFVWTPAGAQAYAERGRFASDPRVGSAVFFAWPEVGRICHVGIVEALRPDGVVTIEGNTDSAGGGTGGRVMRHVRRANIVGYGHPIYDHATAPQQPPPAPAATGPTIRWGARGDAVRRLQERLNANGAHLVVDGIFGPATNRAVQNFQGNRSLAIDGIVGPRTWAALGA